MSIECGLSLSQEGYPLSLGVVASLKRVEPFCSTIGLKVFNLNEKNRTIRPVDFYVDPGKMFLFLDIIKPIQAKENEAREEKLKKGEEVEEKLNLIANSIFLTAMFSEEGLLVVPEGNSMGLFEGKGEDFLDISDIKNTIYCVDKEERLLHIIDIVTLNRNTTYGNITRHFSLNSEKGYFVADRCNFSKVKSLHIELTSRVNDEWQKELRVFDKEEICVPSLIKEGKGLSTAELYRRTIINFIHLNMISAIVLN